MTKVTERKELGAWAHEPVLTAEEQAASYSKAINDRLPEHIETIAMVIAEAMEGGCKLDDKNLENLGKLGRRIAKLTSRFAPEDAR